MKWRYFVLLAVTLSSSAIAADSKDIEVLLEGVSEVSASVRTGTLCVFGDQAFPVVALSSPQRRGRSPSVSVCVAAGKLGKGRVVAFGHTGYFDERTLKDENSGRPVLNAVRWAGGAKRNQAIRVGVFENPGLSAFLKSQGLSVRDLVLDQWREQMKNCRVLCMDPKDFTRDGDLEAIEIHVRNGGGLVAFGLAREWRQTHTGKSLANDYPGNRLLGVAGIVWVGGYTGWFSGRGRRDRDAGGSIAIERDPPRMLHTAAAVEALTNHRSGKIKLENDEMALAGSTLARAIQSLPKDNQLILPKIKRLQKQMERECIPSSKNPLSETKKPLERIFLGLDVEEVMRRPAEEVEAHPAADEFPGAVPAKAKRVTRQVEFDTSAPGWHNYGIYGNAHSPYWHSTGLYAAPGELITITVPETVIDKGLHVRLGAHSDSLMRTDTWRRAPQVCRRFPITQTVTKAANAFGGLVYIESPFELKIGTVQANISGAVEAPHYILGETTLKDWRKSVRRRPAPWGELETKKLVLTLPSEVLQSVEDPEDLMIFWNGIMDRYAELLGRSPERRRAERFVSDEQISVGYMHSGYPLMTMLDICPAMVDKKRILSNGHHGIWGLFHEIGHNHQNSDWTFGGTTEVTVNLFSLYVMEKVCAITKDPHPGVIKANREKGMKKYLADGAPFDTWKRDPFLALGMYIQLKDAFGWEAFTKVFTEYRNLPDSERPKSDDEKRDLWLTRLSRTTARNLAPFFQAWGVPTSEKARASIADLPGWMPDGFPSQKAKAH